MAARRTTPLWTHHLGTLAASLGNLDAAKEHFRAAVTEHDRLGAAGWLRLSEQSLDNIRAAANATAPNEFRLVDGRWSLRYAGRQVWLPDSKGLGDIATLIGAHGNDVHVLTLVGHDLPRTGADPILDARAKAEFRTRLDALAEEIEDAQDFGNADRAETLRTEREALVDALATATGLGGRPRMGQPEIGSRRIEGAPRGRGDCGQARLVRAVEDPLIESAIGVAVDQDPRRPRPRGLAQRPSRRCPRGCR